MKNCISASSALLVTAMMVTLSFGCGEGIEGETGSQSAALSKGQCNAIVARALRPAQQCFNVGCDEAACEKAGQAFFDFFGAPFCAEAFANGELNGLSGNASIQPSGPNADDPKHIGEVICSAVVQCGFCPVAVPSGVCVTICPPEPPM